MTPTDERPGLARIRVCARPVFIVGAPRSSTSGLHWALVQHDELWGSEESDFLTPLTDTLPAIHAAGTRRGDRHWLGRQNVPLADLLPGARFLLIVHDGRQVVASMRKLMGWRHARACRNWRRFVDAGTAFLGSRRGDRMLRVRYESLVSDTEAELNRTFDWLELTPEPRSVWFVRERAPINASPGTEVESSADKLAPRWHAWSKRERRTFARIAGSRLIELGYESDDDRVRL